MINKYINIWINKWNEYKIRNLNKEIEIFYRKREAINIIEKFINNLNLNNLDAEFTSNDDKLLVNKKVILMAKLKLLEEFIELKMKSNDFVTVISKKDLQKITLLKKYINKKLTKPRFGIKLLRKLVAFKSYFQLKLLEIEEDVSILENKRFTLNNYIIENEISFLEKQTRSWEKQRAQCQQKIKKCELKITINNNKLLTAIKEDYQNTTKYTIMKFIINKCQQLTLVQTYWSKEKANLELKQEILNKKIRQIKQKIDNLSQQKNHLQMLNKTKNELLTKSLPLPEKLDKVAINNSKLLIATNSDSKLSLTL